ncbi:ABC transporter ATP-binding protein [Cryptosporangium aurantiacum]|uniref:ABC-2 type transport system ATP-binding protein n=1 Tax=Cryptosporangium aurantiacum TaxID=134849 RepID=A0A1M7RN99_9ACTN|nr:ABC transporter ATP-binding protein [Cryptosporangium aurantiacum]SHN47681.1 ABC-2 type transport system ATP-binding protein [Cryptosporangium aurantiacum]
MPIIKVQGLRKVYGSKTVVDDVSFTVEEGEIFGILGPNGAGKTTAVECIEGLRVPEAGMIRVAGLDPIRQHDDVTRILGVQLQESELQAKLTVREALRLYSALYPNPIDWRSLVDRMGLGELLEQRFGKLSGGQKQRLFVALSLVGSPKIVVFDELTTALDPRARRETWKLVEDIRNAGTTVLLVTHFMEEAEHLCDRLAVFDRGKIVALDTPAGLISRSESPIVISFRPQEPVADNELRDLPGASLVSTEGARVVINGNDATVEAVNSLIARKRIRATELRIVDATLDDAFLNITGKADDATHGGS